MTPFKDILILGISRQQVVKTRRKKLLEHARNEGYDAIAAFEPQNVFYLTGFWGEAIAICFEDSTKLVTPKLEVSRAQHDSIDCEVIPTERGTELVSTFVSEITTRGKTCTDCTDYGTLESIKKQFGNSPQGKIFADQEVFFQARKIKDKEEIKTISNASRILDRLFEICIEKITAGMTERTLQAILVYEGMKMGANPPSYKSTLNPLIIAGGPNGALPHAEVSDRKFRKGDMIVVDLTLRHEGYIADATRTFGLTSATEKMQEVYDHVRVAQEAGLRSVKSGKTCGQVDLACRRKISEAGYEKEFIHSTGHGIGLDVHEPPWVRSGNSEILKSGMAVTVEPGIYLPGKFGVRIEDSVVVTEGRPNVLNSFTKELVIL